MKTLRSTFWIAVLLVFLSACSTAKKKSGPHPPELSALLGKKVALISVDGEDTAKKIIEVALVNQLIQKGTFILLSKQDVETAKTAADQDPTDWRGIAKRAGADYALQAKVIKFDAPIREGYSTKEVYDSQLAEEQGTDGKTEKVYKVKALEGHVKIQLTFTELENNQIQTALAEADDRIEASAESTSIHLPPKLRFLETLSNKAFERFFEKYQ